MKHFFTLLACAVVAVCASAQAGIPLGYCAGEVVAPGILKVEGAATVSGAIYLSPEELSRYAGNSISSVNAGLATKLNISELTAWVRESLDGPNLAKGTLTKATTPKLAKGWNEVALDAPVALDGAKGLYVGFSIVQSKTTMGLSTVGAWREGGLWVQENKGKDWTAPTNYGVLSVEAVVTGDALPSDVVAVLGAECKQVVGKNEGLDLVAKVRNLGANAVSSFTICGQVDGCQDVASAQAERELQPGELAQVELSIPLDEAQPGVRTAQLWASVVNGNAVPGEPAKTPVTFTLIDKAFTRVVLQEEFTTEDCGYCPGAATALHQALEGMGELADRVVVACHHSGYYTDWLTQPCDNEYVWFYGSNGSYAPAFMTNRTMYPGGDGVPVYGNIGDISLRQRMTDALDETAYVGLTVSGRIDAGTHRVKVDVAGERAMDLGDVRITVYAVEDGVKARAQSNGGSNFTHNHVLRAYNSTWGEPIEWDGDTFTYSCELSFDAACKTDNMEVFAFVNKYNKSDRNACQVLNAARMTDPSGVEQTLQDNTGAQAAYYDLMGRRVIAPKDGVFVKVQNGKAVKVAM